MKNIVWLVSYPKSGNTWFRMFLANYLNDSKEPLPLEKIECSSILNNAEEFEEKIAMDPFEMSADEVDFYRPELYRILSDEAANTGNILYKKTHDAYTITGGQPLFPGEVSLCSVYFIRNPLDVCISYSNHRTSEVSKNIDFILNENAAIGWNNKKQLRQILMSWKTHIQSWKNQSAIPVHFLRYEDMLQNPMDTFGDTIRFIGIEYDEERLKRAIRYSDFKTLKQMEKEDGFSERMQQCKSFFWKGKAGNYRDYLSQEQIDKIVDYNYETMREFGYIDENRKLTV
jgi:hypothetical protein